MRVGRDKWGAWKIDMRLRSWVLSSTLDDISDEVDRVTSQPLNRESRRWLAVLIRQYNAIRGADLE